MSDSRQVSWWPVHEFVTALIAQAGTPPTAGTPAWMALADSDPLKVIALAVAGEHHVLRMETAQETAAEASKGVAASADWPAVSRRVQRRADAVRSGAYIARRRPA
ncbi:MAG TPA: DUF2742 domain-containing protein [Mycobacterium sp.]|nr:MAG: DUF2742 domain-containing protein [Mycobacterium sp.]HOB49720.1 DUF2742 domain-containing protein [Mycobacterium sp.]HPZ95449.1 DUF2742 domain-containing protein [Mycobacterium sp.]HQE14518.1 DUF2742 domain-containing protein [Mycobacterium sp.]